MDCSYWLNGYDTHPYQKAATMPNYHQKIFILKNNKLKIYTKIPLREQRKILRRSGHIASKNRPTGHNHYYLRNKLRQSVGFTDCAGCG
ncbi:hypothetical protein [Aeromonas simiae]|uniref:hypothetical protein n=1 Tax=Aeromonas simiae TaxID=218936 RepID=UPI0012EECE0B|nr:hypothetical protein [Aeromonas simiae]MDO2949946.1 hypothetical protein [Aeromonas simiae]MDO2953944.1 hypothetical protein [Aeromonas simiae]MDO2957277.1 hypothetical protein [Aeromonas simiae]